MPSSGCVLHRLQSGTNAEPKQTSPGNVLRLFLVALEQPNSSVAAAACDMNEFSTLLTGVEFLDRRFDATNSAVADVSEGQWEIWANAIPHAVLQTTGHPTFPMKAECEMRVNLPSFDSLFCCIYTLQLSTNPYHHVDLQPRGVWLQRQCKLTPLLVLEMIPKIRSRDLQRTMSGDPLGFNFILSILP